MPKALAMFLVAVVCLAGFTTPSRADQSIILRSGNGIVDSQDSQVRFLDYRRTGDITPSAQDFTTVQTGTFAYVNNPYSTYIKPANFSDPLAQWISTNGSLEGGSTLYAIPFTVTDSVIGSASLELGYAVDNAINGIYINGTLISGNSHDGDYHGEYYQLRGDIGPLLKPNSVNWLYLNASDYGGLAGIIYKATITIQGGKASAPSISPSQGGNMGSVTVRIIGSGFQRPQPASPPPPDSTGASATPGSQFKLTGIGAEIDATGVTVVSPNIITGTFDLTGAPPGVRTVTVTNPDNSTVVLNDAFTVLSGGCVGTTLQALGTPPVKGRPEIFYFTYQNNCTVNSGQTTVVEPLEPWSGFQGSDSDDPDPPQILFPGQLEWTLPSLPPGGSDTIEVDVTEDPTYPVGSTVEEVGCTAADLDNLAKVCGQQYDTGEKLLKACDLAADVSGFGDKACNLAFIENVAEYGVCMGGGHAYCAVRNFLVRGSLDPNDLTGPTGGGTQGWFQDNAALQYTLSYNNMPTATNPATDVYLTDTFDPTTMDLSSLTVGAISIPGGSYIPPSIPLLNMPFTRDIDLRPSGIQLLVRVSASLNVATSQVNISLHTLDPNTGLTPADPTIGFLQPGAGGSVLFTLSSKPGLTTGMAIKDNASVIFDSNAPINAPEWLNTVDTIAPVSHVVALPATETSTSFNVSWTGTDVGSGIEYYSIFVSDNGGPFTEWLTDTAATSGTYTGTIGHTYGFYSIGQDFATNQEAAKTAADTSTTVVAKGSTAILLTPNPAKFTYGQTVIVGASLSGTPTPTGTLSYIVDGGAPHAAALTNGKATISAGALPAGNHSLAVSYGGDSNYIATSDAITIGVAQAQLTVTADSLSRPFGAANPSLPYKVVGFVNGDSNAALNGSPVLSTTATALSLFGEYPIAIAQGSLASANYDFIFVNGTLMVTSLGTVLTPTLSIAGGTYAGTQSVTLKDSTAGATIFYTTDGTLPSGGSTKYTAPIPVAISETLKAVAIAPGYTNSAVASAAYVIATGGACTVVDYSQGFGTGVGLKLNGSSRVVGGALELTDGKQFEAGSTFFATPLPATSFTTDFTFQLVDPQADGITFVIQNSKPTALGIGGSGLGYQGISESAALKFDLHNNAGEGSNSTGEYLDGASPTVPAVPLTEVGIDLHSGHVIAVHLAYNGKSATISIRDTVTNAALNGEVMTNLAGALGGGNSGYFGFTGGTGRLTATQKILTWSYRGGEGCSSKP